MSIAKSSIKMISKIYAPFTLKRVEISKSINNQRLIRNKDCNTRLNKMLVARKNLKFVDELEAVKYFFPNYFNSHNYII